MLRRAFLWALSLTALWLLAFVVRLAPYRQVFSPTPFADGSRISLFDTDPFYHARRVMLFMRTFPFVQYHDSYYAYPGGGEVMWPPLFDWTIAGAAKLLGHSPDREESLLWFLAFIPPILGAFSVLCAYALARQVMDRWSAFVGAVLLALTPGHMLYSVLVRLDHHAGEMVTVVVMIFAFNAMAGRIQTTRTAQRGLAMAFGATVACSLATTLGAFAFIVLLGGFVVLEALLQIALGEKEVARYLLRSSWMAFLAAFILLLPLCWHPPWFTPSHELRMGLSWSHLYAIGAILIILFAMERACGVTPSRWRTAALMAVLAVALSATTVAVPVFAASWLLKPIGIAGTYLAKGDPWLRTIWEAQPLLFDRGAFHPRLTVDMLTGFVVIYPLLALALLVLRIRRRENSILLDSFIYWALLMGLLGFARKRFVYLFAVALSLVVGYVLVGAVRWLWSLTDRGRGVHRLPRLALTCGGLIGLAAVCALCLYFPIQSTRQSLRSSAGWNMPPAPMRETFAWIRRNTPPTRFFDDPAQKPEYGVIYESDKSIWLLFYAHRPIVGAFWDKHAIDPFKFYMAESEDEANEICDRTQTRYVVAYPIIFYSLDYAEIAGKDPNRYMLPVKKASDGEPVFRPTDRYWHLIGERLSRWDGVSPWEAPGSPTSLQRYRLVHESEPFTDIVVGNPASLKVFEYVKGARIVGHTMPRAAVRADVSMVTNRNRSYLYTTQGRADERGKFVLTVPYATTPALSLEPSTRSVSTYRISSLGLDAFTGVTEDDVLQGYEVPVAFRAP